MNGYGKNNLNNKPKHEGDNPMNAKWTQVSYEKQLWNMPPILVMVGLR